jgi:hypothetical protein
MGSIILTGISHGKHQFSLTYPEVEGVRICMAHCKCGSMVRLSILEFLPVLKIYK